jgi:hypothetical protein
MRRQVRAALNTVDELIPVPWDLDLLVRRVAQRRGRPIRLVAAEFPADRDVSGLWIDLPEADYICYSRGSSPSVREQTIGHELGHLLMNHHRPDGADVAEAVKDLLSSDISPRLIERFLARTSYGDAAEAAAEEFGTRLVQARHRRRDSGGDDPLARLTDSLR